MVVVDLFCGCGGLSEGFEQQGFDILLGIDNFQSAIETFRYNHESVGINRDLTELEPEESPVDRNQVTGVVGGPPCQDFSVANRFSRGGEKTNLVFVFADWVNYLRPDFFVMENVPGITSVGTVFKDLLSEFDEYVVNYQVCDASNYAVPQNRKRMIVVGMKDNYFHFPSTEVVNQQTVSDAFENIPHSVSNQNPPMHQKETIQKFQEIEQGEPVYENWGEKVRLDPDKPAPTLKAGKRANYHFVHPEENRGLTIRERARLQGFCDDFVFRGSMTEKRTQTGNAVPPPLANTIAKKIKESQ
jgi:DNA (cytosine-5)-methyltransferase 1